PHCRPGHSDPAPYAPISTYLRLTNGIALSGADPDQADRLLILVRGGTGTEAEPVAAVAE
ncbi:MAG: hypothetical protein JWL58_3041, partial [Streptosporangiaceae bacterium]|nr:hypothetical protein [Streptosporangiaceae bacterium]